VDISDKDAKPYPGWPVTFNQLDNYARKAVAYLPTLKINRANQVVQVLDEKSGEVVYTVRIRGKSFRPKVFSMGNYVIKVGEGSMRETFNNIKAAKGTEGKSRKLQVKL
jgi:hypothetical protein